MDPFLGTGTTMQAAILLGRNSCGYEIDPNFESIIREGIDNLEIDLCNSLIKQRFDAHKEFIAKRKASGKEIKYFNDTLNFAVMTSQEKEIELNYLDDIKLNKDTGTYVVTYEEYSDLTQLPYKDTLFKTVR